jgi:hypothetical protein
MKTLLRLAMLLVAVTPMASAQPATQPAAGGGPTTRPAPRGANAPPADQLLNSMLKPPQDSGRVLQPLPDPPKVDAGTGKVVAPIAPQPTVMREGSYVVDRVGRLTKTADGQQWEVTFEADGRALQDPPMLILPNLKLAAMEQAVSSNSRDLRFRITGMVTEYKGKNYILLEKVLAIPDQAQQF